MNWCGNGLLIDKVTQVGASSKEFIFIRHYELQDGKTLQSHFMCLFKKQKLIGWQTLTLKKSLSFDKITFLTILIGKWLIALLKMSFDDRFFLNDGIAATGLFAIINSFSRSQFTHKKTRAHENFAPKLARNILND